jgi:hypothetical protein
MQLELQLFEGLFLPLPQLKQQVCASDKAAAEQETCSSLS